MPTDSSSVVTVIGHQPPPRRGFLKQVIAVVIGGLVGAVPALVGVATFLSPLRKKAKAGAGDGFFKVGTVDSLASGQPQTFKIVADRTDAWNTFPQEPIGTVYLQKAEDGKLRAFNMSCPHAGCAVDFRAEKQCYHCPCHNSSFALDGKRDASSPSARDLDALPVEVRENGEIWVKFQNFKAGVHEQIPS